MKNVCLIITFLLLYGLKVYSQQDKVTADRAKEKEIEQFIEKNFNKYKLTSAKVQALRADFEEEKLHGHNSGMEDDFLHLLEIVKEHELRKLYFEENPETEYSSSRLAVPYICDNGGFEDGNTNYYDFKYDVLSDFNLEIDCDLTNNNWTYFSSSSTINNPSSKATLVNNDPNISAGNDILLESHGIHIPRVNIGNYAVKLNDDYNNVSAGYTGTTMSKLFYVSSTDISYSFSLIVENPTNHDSIDQPHFIARLIRASDNQVIDQNCIISSVLNSTLFNNAGNLLKHNGVYNAPLLYTGWQCASLNTGEIEEGELAILQFIITDCGAGAHYGTVYIDDICVGNGDGCAYGGVDLEINTPEIINCPTFPINICGSFAPPHTINTDPVEYGILTSIELKILQNGMPINPTIINNPVITGNQFCFNINEIDFGGSPSGVYEYQAIATFSISNTSYTIEDTSANAGPDITFEDCDPCPDCIDISADVLSSSLDQQEAEICINSNKVIDNTSQAIYHAGTEIVLTDGFYAALGSDNRFYIEGCSGNYVKRVVNPNTQPDNSDVKVDLIPVDFLLSEISIYPNPTNDFVTIGGQGLVLQQISLYGIDGKQIYSASCNNESYKLDMNTYQKGIYLLTVSTTDGKTTTVKLIKN
ncbi:T9SS type A sorting domain-containing protein [Flavobacterium rhizosphaerae]|uniref:T9SS type A sorting domain-containing protein n=1 Tax=Flavobacterium rhizosphaerae TaxID=3163298 RepID=A0ABW8YVS2_9FLAO